MGPLARFIDKCKAQFFCCETLVDLREGIIYLSVIEIGAEIGSFLFFRNTKPTTASKADK